VLDKCRAKFIGDCGCLECRKDVFCEVVVDKCKAKFIVGTVAA
jgi:hypothetical protein